VDVPAIVEDEAGHRLHPVRELDPLALHEEERVTGDPPLPQQTVDQPTLTRTSVHR
jgi:hypothetical protein